MIIVIMGVCGCGKTSVGLLLAKKLQWQFADGDDFHPHQNKDKMSQGHPLTDQDRVPWLLSIHNYMKRLMQNGQSAVVTCSALKRSYRDLLRSGRVFHCGISLDSKSNANPNIGWYPRMESDREDTSREANQNMSDEIEAEKETLFDKEDNETILEEPIAVMDNHSCADRDSAAKISGIRLISSLAHTSHSQTDSQTKSHQVLNLIFIHLTGSRDIIEKRLCSRQGHFMPATLLQSQLNTLENLENEEGFEVKIDQTFEEIVNDISNKLNL